MWCVVPPLTRRRDSSVVGSWPSRLPTKLGVSADVQLRKESHQDAFHIGDSEVFVGHSRFALRSCVQSPFSSESCLAHRRSSADLSHCLGVLVPSSNLAQSVTRPPRFLWSLFVAKNISRFSPFLWALLSKLCLEPGHQGFDAPTVSVCLSLHCQGCFWQWAAAPGRSSPNRLVVLLPSEHQPVSCCTSGPS